MLLLKLIYFMKDYKKEAILGPVFKLIEAILELFIPIVMAKIIDIGVANKDYLSVLCIYSFTGCRYFY